MNRLLILEENMRNTINHGLTSGQMIWDESKKTYSCHLQQGALTYYAVFVENDDASYTVLNTYRHRMSIVEWGENDGTD